MASEPDLMVSIDDLVVDGRERRGRFVRLAKESAASAWNGDVDGTGARAMNAPGGKEGARILMYQPRFGLWIVQQSVDVAFSWTRSRHQRKRSPVFSRLKWGHSR